MTSPIQTLSLVLILLIALQHVFFFVLESFLWRKPLGLRVFRMDAHKAEITAPLAANQGVYNAFLAAGLLWGLWLSARQGLGYAELSRDVEIFFLGCVAIAGAVGGMTVNRRIFWIQGVPALVALGVVFL